MNVIQSLRLLKKNQQSCSFSHSNFNLKQQLHFIGACFHEGQPIQGVELAPQALRNSGLIKSTEELKWKFVDCGDLSRESLGKDAKFTSEQNQDKYKHVKNTQILGRLSEVLSNKTYESAKNQGFVLTVGGDHSVATGSISGLQRAYDNLKVIWVDAHLDIGDPAFSNGIHPNYHGIPVAHLTGIIPPQALAGFDWFQPKLKTTDLVYIGTRLFDDDEMHYVKSKNIKVFSPYEITKYGINRVMEMAVDYLDPTHKNVPIHLSFDVDAMDPSVVKATGTQSRGGLDYREGQFIVRYLKETGNLVSMDLTELNPLLEKDEKNRENYNADNPHIRGKESECFAVQLVLEAIGNQ